MALKPLNQEDFPLKIIKDLGVVTTGKPRRIIVECPKCKKHFESSIQNVKRGLTTGCRDCGNRTCSVTGEGVTSPLYEVWRGIKKRCYTKSNKSYKYYGAKGVTMCDEWLNDYKAFEVWCLENGYKEGLQIDKDKICDEMGIVPKIYSPATCIWMTAAENLKIRSKL